MNDNAMIALFLAAFLKSAVCCLYGPLLNPEKYLASMEVGKLPGRDADEYPASLRSFFAFRSFDLYASGSSFREGLVRPLAMSAQERLTDEIATDDQAIDMKAEEIELPRSASVYFEMRKGCYNFEGHKGHVKQIVLIPSVITIKVHPPAPVEEGIAERAKT